MCLGIGSVWDRQITFFGCVPYRFITFLFQDLSGCGLGIKGSIYCFSQYTTQLAWIMLISGHHTDVHALSLDFSSPLSLHRPHLSLTLAPQSTLLLGWDHCVLIALISPGFSSSHLKAHHAHILVLQSWWALWQTASVSRPPCFTHFSGGSRNPTHHIFHIACHLSMDLS